MMVFIEGHQGLDGECSGSTSGPQNWIFFFSLICVRLPENYRQAFFLADRGASVESDPLLNERSESITSTGSFQEFWQFLCCVTHWLKATVSGKFWTWASDQCKSVWPYAWTSLIAAVWTQFHRNRWLSGLGHESLIHECTQRNQTYCMRDVCCDLLWKGIRSNGGKINLHTTPAAVRVQEYAATVPEEIQGNVVCVQKKHLRRKTALPEVNVPERNKSRPAGSLGDKLLILKHGGGDVLLGGSYESSLAEQSSTLNCTVLWFKSWNLSMPGAQKEKDGGSERSREELKIHWPVGQIWINLN